MLLFLVIILLELICLADASLDLSPHLDKASLAEVQEKTQAVAVMFYAPWCGHSKNLLPHWDETAARVNAKGDSSEVSFGKVDCVAEPSLYWKYDIESFPTIKVFMGGKNGMVVPYDGDRDMNSIEAFVNKLAEPKAQSYSASAAQSQRPSSNTHAHLTVPVGEEVLVKRFDAACKRVKHLECYYSHAEDADASASEFFVEVYESMEGEATSVRVQRDMTATQIMDALRLWAYPRVIEMHSDVSVDYIFTDERPGYKNHIILMVDGTNQEQSQRIIANARATQGSVVGEAIFMYIDTSTITDFQKEILEQLKIDLDEAPIAAAVLSKETAMEFYVNSDGSLEDDMLLQWVSAVLGGYVRPTDKKTFNEDGEEEPSEQDQG